MLAQMSAHGLGQPVLFHEFHQADLGGNISIAGGRFLLGHHARSRLQHRRRMHIALLIKELRHADFFTENSCYLCHNSSRCPQPTAGQRLFVLFAESLDLDIHTGGKIQLHQRIHGLLAWDREYPAAACECGSRTAPATSCRRAGNAARNTCSSSWAMESGPRFARRCAAQFLRFLRSTGPECGSRRLSAGCEFFRFLSRFPLTPAGFSGRKELAARCKPLWLSTRTEILLAALRLNNLAYFTISLMVPAPTVCPPSRMAKRKPFSIATGVINSITRLTLSPGITISVPAGNSATPVTSVVLR